MKKASYVGTLILFLGIGWGCGGAQKNPEIQPGPMPEGGDFDGVYQSDFGRLELTVNGDTAVGLFEDDQSFGQLQGTVSGRLLNFTWTQWTEDMQGKARKTTGRGVFKYDVEIVQTTFKPKDTHRLKGFWAYDNKPLTNIWNAYRLSEKSKKELKPHNLTPTGEMPGAEEYENNSGFEDTKAEPETTPQATE